MKFTLGWLKDHLETHASVEEICTQLVRLGLEVESVTNPAEKIKDIVVGYVQVHGKHPNADRLSLCQVDIGQENLVQVVCGAANVRQGMKVAFANIGAVIPATGQALKKGKIRDIESFGMLCSAEELQMGGDAQGIMDLITDAVPGTPLAEALQLGDPIIEVAVTPNRADCFGVRGIARDLAATGIGTLRPLPYRPVRGVFDSPISVTVEDTTACPDFRGVYLKGVQNGPSPAWVQQRLEAVGLRPINALVDVTNYLTYDLGRPLHVFDAAHLNDSITVRLSYGGEKFIALTGKEYELKEGMTVITSGDNLLALGGVMGSQDSGCTEQTTDVFLECALFDPIRTANTGRYLNLISDARTRFERGVDPESQSYGLAAALNLILDWCGGSASHIVKATSPKVVPAPAAPIIRLTHEKLLRLSGCDISMEKAAKILQSLGFKVTYNTAQLEAEVPSHRMNIHTPTDLISEILRLYGYDNIPEAPLPPVKAHPVVQSSAEIARLTLAGRGFQETVSWSFISEKKAALFGKVDASLVLENPLNMELAVMRSTALPNHIEAVVRNANRGLVNIALFEVGPHFNPHQHMVASGLRSGHTHSRHWLEAPRPVDMYDVKADVIAVLKALGVKETNVQIDSTAPAYYHPGRSATLKQGNKVLAYFGEIHPQVAANFDACVPLIGFEILLDHFHASKSRITPLTLSSYQTVTRDFAFVVDKNLPAEMLVRTIQKVDKTLIKEIQIFDVYTGSNLGEDKKSIAIEVKLEPSQATLTEQEIQDISDRIINAVTKATHASLRQ